MNIPKDLKYAKSHEWVKVEGNIATVGISDYAQDQMGDVVFVELPFADEEVEKDSVSGAIESAKAVEDIKMPVSGTIIATNEELESDPELVNSSPYEKGWILKIEMSDPGELDGLLDAEQYSKLLEKEN